MSPETVIYKLQRALELQLENLTNVITTGVDSMEKYKYMLGQAHAYEIILQEISNLLKPKEQQDEQGNVIDIGEGSTKN